MIIRQSFERITEQIYLELNCVLVPVIYANIQACIELIYNSAKKRVPLVKTAENPDFKGLASADACAKFLQTLIACAAQSIYSDSVLLNCVFERGFFCARPFLDVFLRMEKLQC